MTFAACRFLRGRVPSQAFTRSSSQRGTYTVQRILTFVTCMTCLCLRSLHHRFILWTKPDTTSLLLGMLIDLSRSKSQLVAENALLRQQLIILRRQVKRPACCTGYLGYPFSHPERNSHRETLFTTCLVYG